MIVIAAIFFYQQYHLHKFHLIDSLKNSFTNQGVLIEKGLEFSMMENHSTIVQEMVEELSNSKDVERVWVLDKKGRVKASSEKALLGKIRDVEDTTCQICHDKALEERSRTVIFRDKDGKEVFRNVIAIINQKKCFVCHNSKAKINGVLIIDYSLANMNEQLRSNLLKMAILAFLMIAAMAFVVILLTNRLVLRKIKALERGSKKVQKGDLDERVDIKGNDEISYLAQHFNRMTSSLKASMEQIEQQKRYLEKLINSIDDGVLVIDREFRIVMANHSYLSRFGNKFDDVAGKKCFTISHKFPEHCEEFAFDCPAKQTFELGHMNKTTHCIDVEKGKKEFREIYASPVWDGGGQVSQVVEVIRDITDRKLLEERLIHSEKLASLGVMASGISHEINNPLATVTTCLDGLRRRMKKFIVKDDNEPRELIEYIDLIRNEIGRCKEITAKLLTLAEKPKSKLDPFDIHKALMETISLVNEQAEAMKIRFSTDFGVDVKNILSDEGQIRQVFLNIILNAMDAIGERGGIDISTRLQEEKVIVDFRDTGQGIEEGELDKVFEPFYTKKNGKKGTGLGLTICESIIRQHKGDISIHSEYNKETRVTIELPLNPDLVKMG
jgi:PAS domain S-box-containing protein